MEIKLPSKQQLKLYRSLFRVREDVFALRWEKGKKYGYMPAYTYDPHLYRRHKIKGGSFKDYKDKTYLSLTDGQLIKHFTGEQLVGGYPLLTNNTSWFIAGDFDKENWKEESKTFIDTCKKNVIPAYLERSRSGNGSHVWIFFDQPYPAIRSRKVLISLLEEAGIFSVFDNGSSFDRLFPNQDFSSGKGLGNLIALPLHGTSLVVGNSCFLDPNTQQPYSAQWQFLETMQRVNTKHLDELHQSISEDRSPYFSKGTGSDKLEVQLDNQLHIKRSGLPPNIINFLREELNFANSEYFVKSKSGKSTWNTRRYLKFFKDKEFEVVVPRGFTGKFLRYCRDQKVEFNFEDRRGRKNDVHFDAKINLLSHQTAALHATKNKEFGVIVAPPGSGKTIIGLRIIAEKLQPALIVVHRRQIAQQWVDSIQSFLGIPKKEIGFIGQGKRKVGNKVTVSLIQSLSRLIEKQPEIAVTFGTVLIDECHHIPADSYSSTIAKLSPYFQYGLTATPFRKYNDGKVIFIHLGEVITEIKSNEIESFKKARVVIRNTKFDVPFNPKTDRFETLSKVLIHDSTRNKLILNDVIYELKNGRKAVIITERRDHIDSLYLFLKQSYETITLYGGDSEKDRVAKWENLKAGNYQVLLTTGQLFGEGSDLQNASCLFLVYPFSFKGKLIQYVGRVQRSELTPIIYDYHDLKIDYLHRLFLKRNVFYRKLDKQASLFEDLDPRAEANEKDLTIDRQIKVLVEGLDFRFGVIAFTYWAQEMNIELEFEIENDEIRPEFDVLKPYFKKILNSKFVDVNVYAEFQDHLLVSQTASSSDLEMINKEIIESMKFRFIEKAFLGMKYKTGDNESLLDLEQLQSGKPENQLYNTDEELLDDLLRNKSYKHFRQLRYLASKHEASLMKVRFVLMPFSFVFLLAGNEQFHFILETLDTEEATYIWHFDKNVQELKSRLKEVDQSLNLIKNEGRHTFLEQQPSNFSRILHDYSEDKKGFVVWKGLLEERLT